MPANLTPQTVEAVSILRCHHGELHNPLDGTPRVVYDWQRVTTLPNGERMMQEVARTEMSAGADPSEEIPLVDPVTLQPTGQTISLGGAYAVFVSCAVHSAHRAAASGQFPTS